MGKIATTYRMRETRIEPRRLTLVENDIEVFDEIEDADEYLDEVEHLYRHEKAGFEVLRGRNQVIVTNEDGLTIVTRFLTQTGWRP